VDRTFVRYGIVLGLLNAVGAFGIDMYLPALPMIARELGTTVGVVQLSLVVYLAAVALAQVVYGPVSDAVGRRLPIALGMALFSLASVGCALTHDVTTLIVLRFVQGLGACSGWVVTRAVVRDLHGGARAVSLLSLMAGVMGISPILAPMTGGWLIELLSWRAIFWVLAAVGMVGCCLSWFVLDETHAPEHRLGGGLGEALGNYRRLLRTPRFIGLVAAGGLVQGGNFAFVSGSAFVFIDLHGLRPDTYGIVFALNALALVGGAQLNRLLVPRFGAERVILTAVSANVFAGVSLLAGTLTGTGGLPLVLLVFFINFGSVGFVGSPMTMLVLEPYRALSGTASALMGALQMGCGALGSGLISLFFDGTALPMALVMTGCSLSSWTLCQLVLHPRPMALALRPGE
jgi:DHA1 family bicyclomycin/chloramphenicol resistance-like MFS transporter